jgi:hypothetical protein
MIHLSILIYLNTVVLNRSFLLLYYFSKINFPGGISIVFVWKNTAKCGGIFLMPISVFPQGDVRNYPCSFGQLPEQVSLCTPSLE